MDLVRISGSFAAVALAVFMVDMTFAELNADLATNTSDGLRNIANTAANFACALYQNSPASAIGTDPTGLGAFNNALWTRLCGPRDLVPLPPAPPFSGGQCDELYDINLSVTFGEPDGSPGVTDTRQFNGVRGPLRGWRFSRPNPETGGIQVDFLTADQELSFGIQAILPGNPTTSVNSIVPVDGTDTCGNPFPTFPPETAPLVEVETNINVDFGGFEVNVPISFQPIIIPVGIVLAPVISVNVGPINVQFGPGGVTFSPTIAPDIDITLSPGNDPRPLPPSPRPPVTPSECPEVDLGPINDKLDDIKDQLDDIEECACEPEKEIRTLAFEPANSRNVTVPEGEILNARLNAVDVGDRVRGQFGGGGAPNVEYLGWCAFGVSGSGGDRTPVSYLSSVFVAPPGVTSFSYTLIDGSTAGLVVEYEVVLDTP